MKREVENELHAHAGDLMRFCREHKLGFVLAFYAGDGGDVERATNMDDDELRYVGGALANPAPGTRSSKHLPQEPA